MILVPEGDTALLSPRESQIGLMPTAAAGSISLTGGPGKPLCRHLLRKVHEYRFWHGYA